jgi:hypothetical protein
MHVDAHAVFDLYMLEELCVCKVAPSVELGTYTQKDNMAHTRVCCYMILIIQLLYSILL